MKNLVTEIAKALVDRPEQVAVTEIEGQQINILELRVAKEDIGKVIGKRGRTAGAIRVIVNAAAPRMKRRFQMEIIDENQKGRN